MEYNQIVKEIKDFFQGRGYFKTHVHHTGVDFQLFATYFNQLAIEDRNIFAHILIQGMLGQERTLTRYIGLCSSTIHYFCLAGSASLFYPWMSHLEQMLNNPKHLEKWSKAEDQVFLKDGKVYMQYWNYPLSLWSILSLMKSDNIDKAYHYFLTHAQSHEFRQALQRVKQFHEHLSVHPLSEWKHGDGFGI